MKDYFYQSVVKVASSYSSIDGLKAAILELKRNRKLHSHLVQLLEDLSCHSEMNVRRYVAILLGVCSVAMAIVVTTTPIFS
jgi:recombinational DNA repair protein (RecF pathway)